MKKYVQFIVGIMMIWMSIFVFVPLLNNNEASKRMLDFVEEREIDSGVLFYTESEESVQAEFLLRQKRLK